MESKLAPEGGASFFGGAGVRLRVVQGELRREPDEFIWLLIGRS